MATVPAALIMTAVPAGVAAAATQSSASGSGAEHQYIVILHNQNTGIRAQSAARRTAVSNEQKPVLSQLHSLAKRGKIQRIGSRVGVSWVMPQS